MADVPTVEEFGKAKQPGKAISARPEQLSFFSFKQGQEYYSNTGRKVVDLVAGFFSWLLFIVLAMLICVSNFRLRYLLYTFIVMMVVGVILGILSVVYRRKWLGVGPIVFGVAALIVVLLASLLVNYG